VLSYAVLEVAVWLEMSFNVGGDGDAAVVIDEASLNSPSQLLRRSFIQNGNSFVVRSN